MMKKNFIYTIILASISMFSCSDWLDLKPSDGVVENDYWQTKEDVYSVVIGCYSSLLDKTLVNNIILWGEIRADILTGSTAASNNIQNIIRGEISPDNSTFVWDKFYTTINQCNKVIEKSTLVRERDLTFSDAMYRQYLAEATAIRSLMYFYLVRSFQDVPLVLQATDSDEQDYYIPKTEGRVILDSLVRHLTVAVDHLPSDYGSNDLNKGRITRWAAMSLLADIYLWQGNYAGCNNLCTQIIGSGQFTLIPVSRELNQVKDESGNVIDTVYVANSADADNLFDQLYVTGNSIESIFELQFPKTSEVLSDPFYDLFNSTRPKLVAKESILDGVIFPEYEGNISDVFDVRAANFSFKSGGDVWKYVGLSRSGSVKRANMQFPHWIVYRLPDIILMKAEAMNQMAIQNNDDAMMVESYNLVKQVRDRANALETSDTKLQSPINGKSLESLILQERAREFTFEGKRWYDVLRFARRDDYAAGNRDYLMQLAINSAPAEKLASLQAKYNSNWFHYWPIHIDAVEINPNLVQNEFYSQYK